MIRLISIASGSSGNCILVGNDRTNILVDVGISRKRIVEGLASVDLTMGDIDAIVLTHEHSDHTKGLGVILRKDEIPVYATQGTLSGVRSTASMGSFDRDLLNIIGVGNTFEVGDIRINPFATYHDANEPCAYTFGYGAKKCAVVTDTGTFDDKMIAALSGSHAMIIEANHDINMLQVGPYPYVLKQRILSDYGHLSNDACAKLLGRLLCDDTKAVLLGHLSKENNYEELALETVKVGIDYNDTPYKAGDFDIRIAKRYEVTKVAEF